MDKELPPAFGDEMNHADGGVGSDTNHDKLVDAYSKGTSVHILIDFCHLCISYCRNADRITFRKWNWSESDLESSFERFIQTPGHLSLRPHVLQLRIWCCQFLHLWFWINIIVFHTIFIISCHSRFEHLTINYSSIDDSSIILNQRAENRVLTLRIPSSRFENERKRSNHLLRI